jgi:hypothetical protein
MVFFNRIIKVWVVDQFDYFLLGVLIGGVVGSKVKTYFSDKAGIERLKNSLMDKSDSVESKKPVFSSRKIKRRKIVKFFRVDRGGEFEEFLRDYEFSNETLQLAERIKNIIEQLALYLKQRELSAVVKIFFRRGRLILEFILTKCCIDLSYLILKEGVSSQVIVVTMTAGGITGFVLSWISVGAILVSPGILISFFLLRSGLQQTINQQDYLQFRRMVRKMLEELENDPELKGTIKGYLVEEFEIFKPNLQKMQSLNFDEKSIIGDRFDFNLKSDEDLDQFVRQRLKEELGLIENPSDSQMQKVIRKKILPKRQGKIIQFSDFVKDNPYEGKDFLTPEILDQIVDAEIL